MIKTRKKMEVKLILKTSYIYEDKYESDYGFVKTNMPLEIGVEFKFEDLNPESDISDLHPEHYEYFTGKKFKVTNTLKTNDFNGWVAVEV